MQPCSVFGHFYLNMENVVSAAHMKFVEMLFACVRDVRTGTVEEKNFVFFVPF